MPANYDTGLVGELSRHPVREVYGKLSWDAVGGGRPTYSTSGVTFRKLEAYVTALKRRGIKFNYLLNSSCLGNREWDRRWQKKLMRLLERLEAIGVARLTVSTPLLFKIIRRRFPGFSLKTGIYAQVDTPVRARYWEDLGADEITLESFSINRDVERLEKIRRAVRCDLQLIVNHPCLLNCPMQPYHQNGFAHASDGSNRLYVDSCLLACSQLRLKEPERFIQAGWIRPEDLAVYEAIGYDSFKLLERNIPSNELIRRVRAYSSRRFEGNLADLILPYGFQAAAAGGRGWMMRYFLKPLQVRPGRLGPLVELTRMQGMMQPMAQRPIRIDSAKIPSDFLQTVTGKHCGMQSCEACGYCRQVAREAVEVDEDWREAVLARHAEMEESILTGRFWDV